MSRIMNASRSTLVTRPILNTRVVFLKPGSQTLMDIFKESSALLNVTSFSYGVPHASISFEQTTAFILAEHDYLKNQMVLVGQLGARTPPILMALLYSAICLWTLRLCEFLLFQRMVLIIEAHRRGELRFIVKVKKWGDLVNEESLKNCLDTLDLNVAGDNNVKDNEIAKLFDCADALFRVDFNDVFLPMVDVSAHNRIVTPLVVDLVHLLSRTITSVVDAWDMEFVIKQVFITIGEDDELELIASRPLENLDEASLCGPLRLGCPNHHQTLRSNLITEFITQVLCVKAACIYVRVKSVDMALECARRIFANQATNNGVYYSTAELRRAMISGEHGPIAHGLVRGDFAFLRPSRTISPMAIHATLKIPTLALGVFVESRDANTLARQFMSVKCNAVTEFFGRLSCQITLNTHLYKSTAQPFETFECQNGGILCQVRTFSSEPTAIQFNSDTHILHPNLWYYVPFPMLAETISSPTSGIQLNVDPYIRQVSTFIVPSSFWQATLTPATDLVQVDLDEWLEKPVILDGSVSVSLSELSRTRRTFMKSHLTFSTEIGDTFLNQLLNYSPPCLGDCLTLNWPSSASSSSSSSSTLYKSQSNRKRIMNT